MFFFSNPQSANRTPNENRCVGYVVSKCIYIPENNAIKKPALFRPVTLFMLFLLWECAEVFPVSDPRISALCLFSTAHRENVPL